MALSFRVNLAALAKRRKLAAERPSPNVAQQQLHSRTRRSHENNLEVRARRRLEPALGAREQSLAFIKCSAQVMLHRLMEIKARILDCPESDEHIVRRLGKSVVILWDTLSEPAQKQILKQAVLMHDRQRALQLQQKIKAFIRQWKTTE